MYRDLWIGCKEAVPEMQCRRLYSSRNTNTSCPMRKHLFWYVMSLFFLNMYLCSTKRKDFCRSFYMYAHHDLKIQILFFCVLFSQSVNNAPTLINKSRSTNEYHTCMIQFKIQSVSRLAVIYFSVSADQCFRHARVFDRL